VLGLGDVALDVLVLHVNRHDPNSSAWMKKTVTPSSTRQAGWPNAGRVVAVAVPPPPRKGSPLSHDPGPAAEASACPPGVVAGCGERCPFCWVPEESVDQPGRHRERTPRRPAVARHEHNLLRWLLQRPHPPRF